MVNGLQFRFVAVWVSALSAVGKRDVIERTARISRTEGSASLMGARQGAADIRGFIQTFVHTRDVPARVLQTISRVGSCHGLRRTVSEISAVDPHLVQDNGKLTRHGDHGTPMAFCFCQS